MNDEITLEQVEKLTQKVKELSMLYRNAAGKSNVSDNEFLVWYALLVLKGDYTQQNICECWTLPKQTVNSIVKNMITKEFVYLETVPGTKNRKLIRLSPKGISHGQEIVMGIHVAEKKAFGRLSDEERNLFIRFIEKYITYFREELENETAKERPQSHK